VARLQRILAEIFAVAAIWALWDARLAATLIVVLVLARALQADAPQGARRDAGDVPTLKTPAAGASPGARDRPGSGQI
jgi:hypothetical protein